MIINAITVLQIVAAVVVFISLVYLPSTAYSQIPFLPNIENKSSHSNNELAL
jgi:hypothetical protein